jgi:SpoVK/Ycf46/Vps4 family AAA+-type ATPase
VLDPNVTTLLKNDLQSFFQREQWFKKMRLPFRRGYLLHGPPGNGKSTAVRAMLTSGKLAASPFDFLTHVRTTQTWDVSLSKPSTMPQR